MFVWRNWWVRYWRNLQGIRASPAFRPATGRNGALDPAAVEDRPHAIAMAGQQARQGRHEVDQDAPLEPIDLGGPEVDGRAQVEQEPCRDLAILDVLADVWRVHPGGDVPVDVADVVADLVLAKVGEVHPVAMEQAPIVALEEAIESAEKRGFDTGLKLPAILLRYVPFVANARIPGRAMVAVFMALAVLASAEFSPEVSWKRFATSRISVNGSTAPVFTVPAFATTQKGT